MKPGNGEPVFLGNLLPMSAVQRLVAEYELQRRDLAREVNRRQLQPTDPASIVGDTRDDKYVNRAIQEESGWLASQVKGTGGRHNGLLIVASRLESLRLSHWLAPAARAVIDPYAIALEAAHVNGYVDEYGEEDALRAIAWGMGVAEPRPTPPDREQRRRPGPPRGRPLRKEKHRLYLPAVEVSITRTAERRSSHE